MKKSISFVLGLSVMLTVLIAAPAVADTRVVEGQVLIPHAVDTPAAFAHCSQAALGDSAQGLIAWSMPVTALAEYTFQSRAMDLATDSLVAREDRFVLTFFDEKPSCPADPLDDWGTWTGAQGEAWEGTVPEGATWAVVTLDVHVADSLYCLLCPPCVVWPWPLPQYSPCYFTPGPGYFTYTEDVSGEAPVVAKSLRVADVSLSFQHRGKPHHVVSAAATIVDNTGTATAGAEVSFTITSPDGITYTGSGKTDSAGTATFSTPPHKDGHGRWNACVTSVTLDGYSYDAGANSETCDVIDVT